MLLISAMGVAFFVGLRSTSFDMNHTLDTYFSAQGMYDLRVLTTLGLTAEQVTEIAETPGIERVFPAHFCDMFITLGTGSSLARIHSLDTDENGNAINAPLLIAGKLPETADECLVEDKYLKMKGGAIGDIVDVATGNDDPLDDSLNRGQYRVSGTVESPVYISPTLGSSAKGSGTLDTYMYILPENFASEIYSEVYLRFADAKSYSRFSDEYADLLDPIIASLESSSGEMAIDRYASVTGEGYDKIEDGKQEIADAKKKLADAETELADAYVKIADGERELSEKTAEFHTEIADAERELKDAEQKIADAWQEIADAKQELADGKSDLQDLKKGMRELADELGVKKLDQIPDKMRENLRDFSDGEMQLAAAWSDIREGRREITKNRKLLQGGEAALDANASALAGAKAQLADLEQKLAYTLIQKDAFLQQHPDPIALTDPDDIKDWYTIIGTEAQLNEHIPQIKAGIAEADAARAQIDYGWRALDSGMEDLRDGTKELREAEQTLERERKNLQELADELEIASIEELPQGLRDLIDKIPEAEREIADAEKELRDAEQTLSEKTLEYEDGVRELADGRAEGLVKIADAEQELADAKVEVDDGMKKYEDAKSEADEKLPDAERDIADAEKKLSELDEPKGYVLGLDSNIGFMSFQQDSERIDKISLYFPLIFFLVAALVSFTSMVRVVENDRPTIGALKSLGYGNAAIIGKYVFFALAVCIPGCGIGILIGNRLFPAIVFDQGYRIMYTAPPIITVLQWQFCALALAISLLSVLIPTFTVCAAELAGVPATLLRAKPPRSGKRIVLERIPLIWNRMNFSAKVTARNIFRYKKRFLMTVTGVAGCAAILLTGFGLRDSINVIVQKQFGSVFLYGLEITLKENPNQADVAEMEEALRENPYINGFAYRLKDAYDCKKDGDTQSVTLCVPKGDEIEEFISLHVQGSGEPLTLENGGAIITQKLSRLLNANIGDEIILSDDNEREFTVKVSGIAENYVAHYVYVNEAYYREAFKGEPVFNGLWGIVQEMDADTEVEVSSQLLLNEAVTGASFTTKARDFYVDTINSLNIVVMVLVISGALLSFIVLFSLTGINIDERQRELATLKVLGFYERETASYIFRESTVSTLIGVLAGLPAGIALHRLIMTTAEVDLVMFGRDIYPLSFAATIVLSFVFLGIVNWIMGFHIKKIDMIESLKSVE